MAPGNEGTDAQNRGGPTVAITGRLASMARPEAIAAIESLGGRYAAEVDDATDWLVLGEHGWPLRDDGKLTLALRRARDLERQGHAIEILSETEFLIRTRMREHGESLARLFTSQQLSRMLATPLARIREWMRAGLIHPSRVAGGLALFDFREVARARTLHQLRRAGATTHQVRRSLTQLERWLPDATNALAQLHPTSDRQLAVRLDDGRNADAHGQLHFEFDSTDFDAPAAPTQMARLDPQELNHAESAFEAGLVAEGEGRLADAEAAYTRALEAGGRLAEIAFNLGNVLYSQNRVAEAADRFKQAVELDPAFTEAWNNLGNALADQQRLPRAIAAYRRALQLDGRYGDAHYNLAQALEATGLPAEARTHWQTYLEIDPNSVWAAEARARLQD